LDKSKKLTTFPQMFEGEKGEGWTVVSEGIEAAICRTDLEGKVLVVPGGGDVYERNGRLHELSRARWSPHQSLGDLAAKNEVDPAALMCAEDFRLTFNIERASKSLFVSQFSKGQFSQEEILELAARVEVDRPETTMAAPLIMAALGNTEGAKVFLNALRDKMEDEPKTSEGEIKSEAWKHILNLTAQVEPKGKRLMEASLRRSFAGFPKSIELAKILMELQETCQSISSGCREELRNLKGNKGSKEMEMKRLNPDEAHQEKHKIQKLPIIQHFGKMSVKVPPMVMPVKAKNKIARHRVTEEGILPFQLYRLHIDGKIFLDPRKQRGGSVVVDISGSMGLTPDQVYEFVLKCPGATIAQYSGSGTTGELVVVAHKGRIAPRHLIGKSHGGNIVDGPALEWLSHQPRPRVWVSDTQVTGVHDMGSTELRKVCLDWCVKHQIKVVTAFDPITVARSLHSSHRKLVARERKRNPYEG
jgi:hypothetical protein